MKDDMEKKTTFSDREACYYFATPSHLEINIVFQIKSSQS